MCCLAQWVTLLRFYYAMSFVGVTRRGGCRGLSRCGDGDGHGAVGEDGCRFVRRSIPPVPAMKLAERRGHPAKVSVIRLVVLMHQDRAEQTPPQTTCTYCGE